MYRTIPQVGLDLINYDNPVPVNVNIPLNAKRALGLDLGLSCGYAYALYSETEKTWYVFPHSIGIVDLNPSKYETGFTCFLRLQELLSAVNPSVIYYESIKFTPSFETDRSEAEIIKRFAGPFELLTSLRQTMLIFAQDRGIPTVPIPIQVIKKFATGKGKANKIDIIRKCNELFKTDLPEDLSSGADNAADAAMILYYGLLNFGSTCKGEEKCRMS